MRSITLTCHPAALYYWLESEVLGKVTGLRYKGWSIIKENEFVICGDIARHLTDKLSAKWSLTTPLTDDEPIDYLTEFVIESDDEGLLVWVALVGPNPTTPPRDD